MKRICILSDLEIPKGKENREHYCPRSRVPKQIWNDPRNIFWAYSVLNTIKGNLLPCEWEESKFYLTFHALKTWNIDGKDKWFLRKTLRNWEELDRNPCDICLLKCKEKQK